MTYAPIERRILTYMRNHAYKAHNHYANHKWKVERIYEGCEVTFCTEYASGSVLPNQCRTTNSELPNDEPAYEKGIKERGFRRGKAAISFHGLERIIHAFRGDAELLFY